VRHIPGPTPAVVVHAHCRVPVVLWHSHADVPASVRSASRAKRKCSNLIANNRLPNKRRKKKKGTFSNKKQLRVQKEAITSEIVNEISRRDILNERKMNEILGAAAHIIRFSMIYKYKLRTFAKK
jgi:hypothetical protein